MCVFCAMSRCDFSCTFAFDFIELNILWKLERQERTRILPLHFHRETRHIHQNKNINVYTSKSQFAVLVHHQHQIEFDYKKKNENRQLLCRWWNDNYFSILYCYGIFTLASFARAWHSTYRNTDNVDKTEKRSPSKQNWCSQQMYRQWNHDESWNEWEENERMNWTQNCWRIWNVLLRDREWMFWLLSLMLNSKWHHMIGAFD